MIRPGSKLRNILAQGLIPWAIWPRICLLDAGLTGNRTIAGRPARSGCVVPAWTAYGRESDAVSTCHSAGEFRHRSAGFQRSSLRGFGWIGIIGQRLHLAPQVWTTHGIERSVSASDEATGNYPDGCAVSDFRNRGRSHGYAEQRRQRLERLMLFEPCKRRLALPFRPSVDTLS